MIDCEIRLLFYSYTILDSGPTLIQIQNWVTPVKRRLITRYLKYRSFASIANSDWDNS